jgi:hypothetical protein
MGRLIDADALIEKLKRISVFECVRNSADKNVFEIIAEAPTAYDVDAVVEELKSLSNAEADYYYAKSNDVIDRETAIDIVKRGGVE